jgi:hypothetical protein
MAAHTNIQQVNNFLIIVVFGCSFSGNNYDSVMLKCVRRLAAAFREGESNVIDFENVSKFFWSYELRRRRY